MIEISFILLIIGFSILSKKDNIIYLILFLLPFHTFLKSCFTYYEGGGNIFTIWKEIVIIIYVAKVYSSPHLKFNKPLLLILQSFITVILIYYFLSNDHIDSLATLRDHLFPIILFVCLYISPLDLKIAKKATLVFTISVLINCIMGFVQNFFLNIPISMLMGRIDFIDESGYIQYKTTSARILGFERMSGIMGGPNTYGTFCAFALIFLTGVFLNAKKFVLSALQRNFILLVMALTFVCLLLSFSRAGWVISVFGALILLKTSNIKINIGHFIIGFSFLALLFFVLIQVFPQIGDVLSDSLTGKEASAADRTNNFSKALETNLTEPFGHGLGTTDHRYKSYEFFAESAFMNIAYEIGLLGMILLIFLHYRIFKRIINNKDSRLRPFANIAVAITLPTLLVCFVSINPYGIPYIYLWWMVLGLGLNHFQFALPKLKAKRVMVVPL